MTMREKAWIWVVRHRDDGIVLAFGRSHGGRAEACSEAAMAVFGLLSSDSSSPAQASPVSSYRTA